MTPFHSVTSTPTAVENPYRRGTCASRSGDLDVSLGKLPHNVNPVLHTVSPTAAFRTRQPETDMGQNRKQDSQQNQRDQQQQQQQEQQQRNQNQQQGWQDEEE